MQKSRFSRVLALFTILSLLTQLTAFAQDASPEPIPEGVLNVQLLDDQGTALFGCVTVTDAEGVPHTDCTYDGGGWVVFTGLPLGPVSVVNTETQDGYYQAPAQEAFILEDAGPVVTMVSTPVPVEVPTEEPTEVPTEVPTEEPTEVPTEEPVATPTEAPALRKQGREFQPFATGGITANFTCTPTTDEPSAVSLMIPFEQDGGAELSDPVVEAIRTDRFGETTTETVVLDETAEGYLYETTSDPSIWIDFEISAAGFETTTVGGACASWSPIQLTITTVAKDADGNVIDNGGQVATGTSIYDTAVFAGDHFDKVNGTVTYNLYKDDATCGGTPVASYTATVTNGVIADSDVFDTSTLGDGTYDWQVVYAGDVQAPDPQTNFRGNFTATSSDCGSETVVVGSYTTGIATTMMTGDSVIPHGGSVAIGTSVYDTTTLTPPGKANGTVTYTLLKGENCDSATEVSGAGGTVDVVNGAVPPSPAFTTTEIGTYHWVVDFVSSDATFTDITSECGSETFTVAKASPSITTVMMDGNDSVSNNATVDRGTAVHDTATLSGFVPGASEPGTVTYKLVRGNCPDGTEVGETQTVTVGADGTIPDAAARTADNAGTYNWIVSYSGDEFNEAATSGCGKESFKVAKNTPTIETVPQYQDAENEWHDIAPNGVIEAEATVRDTAVIGNLAGVPSGAVTFTLYKGAGCSGDSITVAGTGAYGNVISGVLEDLKPGQYNWVVTYAEDDENASVTSDCYDEQFFVTSPGVGGYVHTVVKNAADDKTVANGASVPLGTSVYDTAQFYGDIRDDGGNAAVSGSLTYTLYKGDSCEDGSVDSWTVEVAEGQPVPAMDANHQLISTGAYNFQATFTPEGGTAISSPCGTEALNVDKVQPTLTTTMHAGDDTIAQNGRVTGPTTVSDSVAVTFSNESLLTGDVPVPTGTLTYTLHKSADCSDDGIAAGGSIANGEFSDSDAINLSDDEYGTYNWVVTYSGDDNYNEATSPCGSETFHLDTEPSVSTGMFTSTDADGDGSALTDGSTVLVGEYVRDTATLTNATDTASGTVTFTLYQGLTCEGVPVFTDTVNVTNGVVESTAWFQIGLFGDYSWKAEYSGDNTGSGYNTSASSCENETFHAEYNDGLEPSMATVMRQGETVIGPGSFVVAPVTVTDQAVFTNLSDEATGTVTYKLYASANCADSTLVGTSEQTVANGIAPRSEGMQISAPTTLQNSVVYSWVVTFEGQNHEGGDPVSLTSGCDQEQFRVFGTQDFKAVGLCTYHGSDDTMTLTLTLSPRNVNNEGPPADVLIQPYNRNLSPADPINLTGVTNYVIGGASDPQFSHQPWRQVDVTVTWNDGTTGSTFTVRCVNRPFQPVVTTAMFVQGDGEDADTELQNGGQIAPGTTIYDTAKVQENTSTYQLSGTLTYTLYKGAVCDPNAVAVPNGTTSHVLSGVTPDELPDSDAVTVTEAGTYFWEVTFTPASGDQNNLAAVSNCRTESFTVTDDPQDTVLPVDPSVLQAFCTEENEPVYPSVTLAQDTDSIHYTKTGAEIPGGTVTITATLQGDAVWNSDLWSDDWKINPENEKEATFTVVLENVDCGPVLPLVPTYSLAVCTDQNEPGEPSVTTPENTDLIHYELAGTIANGQTVVITATLQNENNTWGDLESIGWVVNPENDREATFTIVLEMPQCNTPVIPVAPQTTDGVCTGGEYTAPTVTKATTPEGVTYVVSEIDENGDFTVTATLGDKQIWDTTSTDWPESWTVNEVGEAVYQGSVELNPCIPTSPVNPGAIPGVCTGGEWTGPTLNIGDDIGIDHYETWRFDGQTGDYEIRAHIADGYEWADDLGDWTRDSATQATLIGHVDPNPCVPATPIAPSVSGNVCTGGEYTAPTVDLAAESDEFTYDLTQDIDENGDYIVTATIKDGFSFDDLTNTGWVDNEDGTATYNGHEDLKPCIPVHPVRPDVDWSVCRGGELTEPSITTPDTEGITYSYDENDVVNGGTVVITATVQDGYGWPNRLPFGWGKVDSATATYTVRLPNVRCIPAYPVAPNVEQVVCTGGELTEPSVTTPWLTIGVNYSFDADDVVNGGTVVVTATVWDGFGWPETMPEGWEKFDNATATFTVELDDVNCTPVEPVVPAVDEAVCTGGELIAPNVTTPETEGITYTFDEGQVAPGAKVIVTATVEDGFGWPETMPEGWTKVDNATATFEVNLEDVECEQVMPAAPIVNNAVCTGGALTDPEVLLQETNGVTYVIEGDVVNGGTVTVVATVEDGFAWAETLPEGWTKVDNATATFTVELDDVNCTPVTPIAPVISNAVCTGGTLTNPSVTPGTSEGITYEMEGDVVNGGTVTITATVQDGYGWPSELPEGWTKVDDSTATYTVQLDDVTCDPVSPVIPEITQPVCKDGELVPPAITTPETPGVEYTTEGELVPGGKVVITATIQDGYSWGEMPEGWTKVDDTTATFTVTFDDVTACETPTVPATPTSTATPAPQSPVTKLPTTGNGGSALGTTGITMLLVAAFAAAAAGIAAWMRRETVR